MPRPPAGRRCLMGPPSPASPPPRVGSVTSLRLLMWEGLAEAWAQRSSGPWSLLLKAAQAGRVGSACGPGWGQTASLCTLQAGTGGPSGSPVPFRPPEHGSKRLCMRCEANSGCGGAPRAGALVGRWTLGPPSQAARPPLARRGCSRRPALATIPGGWRGQRWGLSLWPSPWWLPPWGWARS